MSALDEVLRNAQRARLIPVVADSRREERTVSVLLAAVPATRALAKWLLHCCEARTGKTWELRCFTEVEFPAPGDGGAQRADGVLRLSTRTGSWSALLEAKVDGARIDDEQLRRYAEVARAHGVDA